MNRNIIEFIWKLEQLLNDLDSKAKKLELITDIDDLKKIYPELKTNIENLQQEYVLPNNSEDRRILNAYFRERNMYKIRISAFMQRIISVENVGNDILNEITENKEKINSLLYKRHQFLMNLKIIKEESRLASKNNYLVRVKDENGEGTWILKEKEEFFEQNLYFLNEIDNKIIEIYNFLNQKNIVRIDSSHSNFTEHFSSVSASTTDSQIENKDEYENEFIERDEEEKSLININNPHIEIDKNLLDQMTVPQKLSYLAQLKLQIEALSTTSNANCEINGKEIPFRYKLIYQRVLNLLGKIQIVDNNKINFDIETYNKLDKIKKSDYLLELFNKITQGNIEEPIEVYFNGARLIIDKKNLETFQEIQRKIEELKDKKENFKFTESIDELPSIKFNIGYYNSLNNQDKINYCENIIQQIASKEHKNPIHFLLNQEKIEIDETDTNAFIQASSKLLELQHNVKENDIDEEYVKTLSNKEKLEYYTAMIREICFRPITEKVSKKIQGSIYYFDKKYSLLMEVLINRMEAIRDKLSRPVKVKKVEKPKKLDKIKNFLKKKAVQIALSVGSLIAISSMGYQLGKQNTNIKEEVVTEISKESNNKALNDLEPIIIDNVNTLAEPAQNIEKEEQPELKTNFTLKENSAIYTNTDLSEPLTPTYQNDSYRIVAEHYQMPNGTIVTVNSEENNRQEKIDSILSSGGVLQSVSGVAKSGEEDYLENKIPTGVFDINSINLQGNIGDQVSDLVDQELGGRSR